MPNLSILRSPSNWFFVAFCVVLLCMVTHILYKKGE